MRSWSRSERSRRHTIGFVPTMGYLHEGHLRLVDRARELAERVVVSIFVNPLQFGPLEDLARYPRDLPRDRQLALARDVDCLFVPDAATMYPGGEEPLARVIPGPVADTLEGAARPGHFTGVLTVVAKLFHIVEPDVAVFGRKDFQQAMLVKRLVQDLDFALTIDVAPTVRELDGLALSSRNTYLSPDERRSALALSRALRTLEQTWRGGEADPAKLQRAGLEAMHAPGVIPEYCALVDEDVQPVSRVTARTVAGVAARIGKTRLRDNVVLGDVIGADAHVSPRARRRGHSFRPSVAGLSSAWWRCSSAGRMRCRCRRRSAPDGSVPVGSMTRYGTPRSVMPRRTGPPRRIARLPTENRIAACSTPSATTPSAAPTGMTQGACCTSPISSNRAVTRRWPRIAPSWRGECRRSGTRSFRRWRAGASNG